MSIREYLRYFGKEGSEIIRREMERDEQLRSLERSAFGEGGMSFHAREKTRNAGCISRVSDFLSTESDYVRQVRAVRILVHLKTDEAIPELLAATQLSVAAARMEALHALYWQIPPVSGIPTLVKVLESDSPRQVRLAARVLTRIGDASAIAPLESALAERSLPRRTRRSLRRAIASLKRRCKTPQP